MKTSLIRPTEIENYIVSQMQENEIPGFAVGIIQGEELVYAKGFGKTTFENWGVDVTPKTLFRIASNTKPLTGFAAMRLYEAGLLDLDKPVSDYVPWLTFQEPGAAKRITMRMLLSHTAGLSNGGALNGSHEAEGLERFMREELPEIEFVSKPGAFYRYSNYGFSVAGYLLEVICGKPYAQIMREWVFDPLQMKDSTFDPLVAMSYSLAHDHVRHEDSTWHIQRPFYQNSAIDPAFGAMTNIEDLSHFAIMHLNEGTYKGTSLLSPETMQEMRRVHADWYKVEQEGSGLGILQNSYKGILRHWHTGGLGAYTSVLTYAPKEKVAVITLSNGDLGWDVSNFIFDQLLELPAQVPVTLSIKEQEPVRSHWPQLEGSYLNSLRGLAVIHQEGDTLYLTLNGKKSPLSALREDLYFTRDEKGGVDVSIGFPRGETGLGEYVMVNGAPALRWTPPAEPVDAAAWESLVGYYGDAVLNIHFYIRGGESYFHDGDEEVHCFPITSTSFFATGAGMLEFTDWKEGHPSVLVVQGGWRFTRKTTDEV